jgi:2,4-dienoyl-CoA reductase-like NADH-dependent reductase (Old Yellow Enzyme family)
MPDHRYVEFYRSRSSPELHCAIVGNVVIPGGTGSNSSTATISSGQEWTKVTQAISERGTLPGIQLTTAWRGYVGAKSFHPGTNRETIEQFREVVRKLGRTGIQSIFTALDEGSQFAEEAGFRHLQVHAAHGYLFSLLVDYRLNENASEALEGLAAWAMKQTAAGLETSIRISLRTGDPTFDEEGRGHFYEQVVSLPFDFIDVSSGFYNIDKRLIYPGRPDVLRVRRAETVSLAVRYPERRFIVSGRALLEQVPELPPNVHIGLCRDLIANPDYLTTGNGCRNSGKCHYFSRGKKHITCPQWVQQKSM